MGVSQTDRKRQMTEVPDRDPALFSINDAFAIKHLNGIKLSPDASKIVCVTAINHLKSNKREDHIALISTSDRDINVIATGSSPQWSPDGFKIAYVGYADGQSAIWIYDLRTNERTFLTPVHESSYFIDHLAEYNFQWSPDSRWIAYVSSTPFSRQKEAGNEVKEINRLLYKSKGGHGRPFFADDLPMHIWIVPSEGGEPELITPGNYNEHSISWAPDSRNIAFISNRSNDPDNNQRNDVWRVNIQTREVTRLTTLSGSAFQPKWSPDGTHIAYLATDSKVSTNDSPSDDTHLHVIPSEGGIAHCPTKPLDRRIENAQWHPRGEWIYFTAGDKGSIRLYSVSITGGSIQLIMGSECQIPEYSLNAQGDIIVFLRTDIVRPPEIFIKNSGLEEVLKITNENQSLIRTRELTNAQEFWFASFDKTRIQGWIMKPVGFDESKIYPLILMIHGGPHNMYGYNFEPLMQLLSAGGYAVAFMNPRGSSGYGQAFSKGNVLNWGGGDYQDLMAGVDYLIDSCKWIDTENLGVTGQSYGGYMTNWIITQTNRFKAAVADGSISNLISFAGTSIYHSLMESEFNGSVYDNFALLWQSSPLRNVKNVKTPTLFLHGRTDNEVPVSQAEEMYVALKKLGVATSFVQYLEEGHGWRPDLKPANRRDSYVRMIGWFDQYLKH